MVWKKRKHHKFLQKQKIVYAFGSQNKKIFNRFYSAWKKRYLWNFEDSLKFLKKFKKKKKLLKLMSTFFTLNIKRFFLENIFLKKKLLEDFFLKKWLHSLLKILIKDGKKQKSLILLKNIILKIKKNVKNLNYFFLKIKKNMHLPLRLRVRIVAGRKVYIPIILNEDKEIMFILRFILNSLKSRQEKTLEDKLLNELFDVFNNKGLSIKKKHQYNKEIKDNIPNIRYLNF